MCARPISAKSRCTSIGAPARLLVLTAIDNLGKGAAGQAIQNMNLMLGYDEAAGLLGAAPVP